MQIRWGTKKEQHPVISVSGKLRPTSKETAKDESSGEIATAGLETGRVGVQTAEVPVFLDTGQLLEGFYQPAGGLQESQTARPIYHDIFHNDVCGTVISTLAQGAVSDLLWQPGELTKEEFDKFQSVKANLPETNMLVRMTTDCLYCGAGAGLFFTREDEETGMLIPYGFYHYNPVTIDLTPMPFYNFMPIVKGKVDAAEIAAYRAVSEDANLAKYVKAIMGDDISKILEESYANPENLMTMVRMVTGQNEAVSMLRRVLSEWFFNKNLYRGTLENSIRRINGVAHVVVGMPNGADSQPQLADLEYYGQRFHEAAQDPTGAMVVTRDGVSVSSVLDANQFWSYESTADGSLSRRLKLMGVPEALATVDFTQDPVAGVSAAISLFKGVRDMLRDQVLDRRYLPQLSVFARNYKPDGLLKYELDITDNPSYVDLLATHAPMDKLLKMPTYSFKNPLELPPDAQIFDLWDKLKEHGVPMPLGIMAHLAKVDLSKILEEKEADLKLRQEFSNYSKEVAKFEPKPDEGGGGFSGMSAQNRPQIKQLDSGDYFVERVNKQYSDKVKNALWALHR